MAKLIYTATMSLDGFTEDEQGRFDWTTPDEEVHGFINDVLRPIGTYIFGRRMYETMLYWEPVQVLAEQPAATNDFAEIWHAADKIVYSKTLRTASSARTRVERDFAPDAIELMKATCACDISIGGAELAAHAIRAGLVDELNLFVVPIVLAGRKPAIPTDVRLHLELLDEHRFSSGSMYLKYRINRPRAENLSSKAV